MSIPFNFSMNFAMKKSSDKMKTTSKKRNRQNLLWGRTLTLSFVLACINFATNFYYLDFHSQMHGPDDPAILQRNFPESFRNIEHADRALFSPTKEIAAASISSLEEKEVNNERVNHECMSPLSEPIKGVYDHSRILNMGFPKAGSSTLYNLFKSSRVHASHWECRNLFGARYHDVRKGKCGVCMQDQVRKNSTHIMKDCGNYRLFTEMNFLHSELEVCSFPQVFYMEQLYDESPNATWVLPFRNNTDWLRSVDRWGNMTNNFAHLCGWKEFARDNDNRSKDVEKFVCNHVNKVRTFVKEHPTLSLIEYNIGDDRTGKFLEKAFYPLVKASDYMDGITEYPLTKGQKMKTRVKLPSNNCDSILTNFKVS